MCVMRVFKCLRRHQVDSLEPETEASIVIYIISSHKLGYVVIIIVLLLFNILNNNTPT